MSNINVRTLAAAVAGAVALAAVATPGSSSADPKGKEKCYGIAKAGENGCAAANGSHSCAGHSKSDLNGQDWKLVDAGSCEKMSGKLEAFDRTDAPKADDKKGG